jgi:UDP-N-acetylmuramate--alanine ligase
VSAPAGRPWRGRRIHIVGIGGAGMSAYARAAHALGASVSGSDAADSAYLRRLRDDGVARVSVGHAAANVPAGEGVELYYSSAVAERNPERVAARERGIAQRPRADLLGELSALRRTIAVAGSHGKTTTAAMIVHALRAAGMRPSWLVGGTAGGTLGNACWDDGEWLVVEADESDRSLLSLHVEIAVLTNAELDHHASFDSLAEVRALFAAFLAGAARAAIWDRPELLALRGGMPVTPYDAHGVELTAGGSVFAWRSCEQAQALRVQLIVPGLHNAINAAGALTAASLAGANAQAAAAALAAFPGAGRRFQLVGRSPGGALVYDDYAHHPTEVRATLLAARTLAPRRLVAVFQPHLFSRTQQLAREFGQALALADEVAVLDVYPARERAEDHPGVSGLLIARACADAAGGRRVSWLPRFSDARALLAGVLREGDVCVAMGAGDVDDLARELAA